MIWLSRVGTVVRKEYNQCVVILAGLLEVLQETSKMMVHVLYHAGMKLHPSGHKTFLLWWKRVPFRNHR